MYFIQHIEIITDILYYYKYKFIGNDMDDTINKVMPNLPQKLQEKLKFVVLNKESNNNNKSSNENSKAKESNNNETLVETGSKRSASSENNNNDVVVKKEAKS